MEDDNIGNKATDEKKPNKKIRGSLTLQFANRGAMGEFISLAGAQMHASPFPRNYLCLDQILPIPHQLRKSGVEAGAWLGKWTSAVRLCFPKDTGGEYRSILDANTVVYRFELRNVVWTTNLVKNLFLNFNLRRVEFRQDITGIPYHLHDGKVCFINVECGHQFEYADVKTHAGNIVYLINRPDVPHPVFQVKDAIKYLFDTNPERSEEEIQLAYINLITRTSFWKWSSGRHEAKVKAKLYKSLSDHAEAENLDVFKYFVGCGSYIDMRTKKELIDPNVFFDWKNICRDFLEIDVLFE